MHIVLLTVGTRGDVQPYLPLALGFQARGYQVTFATHEIYRDWVTGYDLGFMPIAGDPQSLMQTNTGLDWLETGSNPVAMLSRMRHLVLPLVQQMAADMIRAAQNADAILFSTLATLAGPSLIEKYGIPGMGVFLQPVHPTGEHPFYMLPDLRSLSLPRLNRLSFTLMYRFSNVLLGDLINQVRQRQLALPPYPASGPFIAFLEGQYPTVYGYSRHVIPRPADWPSYAQVAGYWLLDEPDYMPPTAFADWLAQDDKPTIYLGFGSMTQRDPHALTDLVLQAIDATGVRCVLLRGWAGLGDRHLPDTIYAVDSVPHRWLFPQMDAVVHHGGAGTTAVGCWSGVPSIIVPHFADQPLWGRRAAALGVGSQPIPRSKLTASRLTDAIRQAIYDLPLRRRAAQLGAQIRAEDGVSNAVDFFENNVLR